MVTVFACPNLETPVGTAQSWSPSGEVRSPDAALSEFFAKTLGGKTDLCLRERNQWHSASDVRFKSATGDVTYVSMASFNQGNKVDCCEVEPTSAKPEGKV